MRATTKSRADNRSIAGVAAEFGVPLLDLSAFEAGTIPEELIDEQFIRRHNVLPLAKRGGRLFVAASDPANLRALDDLRARTGIDTELVLVEQGKLAAAIARRRPAAVDTLLAELDTGPPPDDDAANDGEIVDEAPVVKYVQKVLLEAVSAGASDIHFEPYETCYRIRMRIDGILRETHRPPVALGARFAARLKVMAQMDITKRRIPQDGRIKLVGGGGERAVDLRASTLPTMHGEKIVLRILDQSVARIGIDQLGLEADQKRYYLNALGQPQGMILVTGPTGSGKTVSLYSGLNVLNAGDRNIATAEEPVEINVEGVNQVQVNNRVGLDFSTALRAFLRQDPDVIMVGEIRDLETAETAIKAAQTGHLVLSTLHTNSAAETLTRLRNMGVPAYNLAASVMLIIAQRLIRLLCRHCKRPITVPAEVLLKEGITSAEIDAGLQLFDANGDGCGDCDRGYRSRTGIYEVVEISADIQRLILADGDSLTLAERARALGYDDLRRSGLKKVIRGLTSLGEVNRVTTRY